MEIGNNYYDDFIKWATTEIELAKSDKSLNDIAMKESYDTALASINAIISEIRSKDIRAGKIKYIIEIINLLLHEKILTPIQGSEDEWEFVFRDHNDIAMFKNIRLSSLWKYVNIDGSIKYTDIDRYYCKDINSDKMFYSSIAENIIDALFPITFPYTPSDTKYIFHTINFLIGPIIDNNYQYDIIYFLNLQTPEGELIEINRYFNMDSMSDLEEDELIDELKSRM